VPERRVELLDKISSLSIEVFCHATESVDKVKSAVQNILPKGFKAEFKSETLTGHHGNPITILRLRIRDPKVAASVLKKIAENLSDFDRDLLLSRLDLHVDSTGSFYMRLDKQEAFKGKITLGLGDDIIRLKFNIRLKKGDAIEFLRSLFESGVDGNLR